MINETNEQNIESLKKENEKLKLELKFMTHDLNIAEARRKRDLAAKNIKISRLKREIIHLKRDLRNALR